ncbi:Crp/Fnr family transcriptional regulator [Aurantibacter crassamenti]|uniref:Crp/Fnr family transcriptional regulator n=1 Tax=Aurantibacter crassamenti TaxID=1837375 RepID=UPI00193A5D2D|nr:Crp/Fnr family transcriptional regulator [Aurantibacter crassamenti]MBM1106868.1 Crp/Fnr family transcriptional regulator [Aurantibacter crassamenti]
MISKQILLNYGAEEKFYKKNEIVFLEGSRADYFYQVKTGKVKMYNLGEDGKEFIQGMFGKGESFGEPPIFCDFPFPANAAATVESTLFRLRKDSFFEILKEHHDIHLKLTQVLSNRLHYKSMIMKEVSVHSSEHRILTLLNYLKKQDQTTEDFEINLTRKQISELTGLRVETVIRAIKKLEVEDKLKIVNRKILV